MNDFDIKFEKATRLLIDNLPASDKNSRKPILFHDIRVAVFLYENGYSPNLILAGLLHDSVEWGGINEEKLRSEFGDEITKIVLANTKDDSIKNNDEKIKELVGRCVDNGIESLIVKTADIIDSFKWYMKKKNLDELNYCIKNANNILDLKPNTFDDKIFDILKNLRDESVRMFNL